MALEQASLMVGSPLVDEVRSMKAPTAPGQTYAAG